MQAKLGKIPRNSQPKVFKNRFTEALKSVLRTNNVRITHTCKARQSKSHYVLRN